MQQCLYVSAKGIFERRQSCFRALPFWFFHSAHYQLWYIGNNRLYRGWGMYYLPALVVTQPTALCHNVQLLNYNMTVCTKRPCYQNIPRKQTHLAFLWNWIFVPGLLGFIIVVAAETDRVGLVGSFCIWFIFCISASILIQLPAFLFDFCFQLCHPHTFFCLQFALVSRASHVQLFWIFMLFQAVNTVKLNFKAGLFSSTFQFEHSFLAKSQC